MYRTTRKTNNAYQNKTLTFDLCITDYVPLLSNVFSNQCAITNTIHEMITEGHAYCTDYLYIHMISLQY